MRRLTGRLSRDDRGATIVEFAIIVPVLALCVLGLSDIMYQAYAQALLDGSIQKAGRDSAIQGGADQAAVIDKRVLAMVRQIAPAATYTTKRQTYTSYTSMKPERYTDANKNGVYDPKECFDDINGNGVWDADPSRTGQGNASDATLYAVTVTYPHLFPVQRMLGWGANQTLTAKTLLKNQPYTKQVVQTVTTICP